MDTTTKVTDTMRAIVATVITAMRDGTAPWRRPWIERGVRPTNLQTGALYTGGNAFYLMILGAAFGCDHWVGYKQARKLGGHVRKGEKGTAILRPIKRKRTDESGEDHYYTVGFALAYIWNVTQCEGIEAPKPATTRTLDATRLDSFLDSTGADIRYGGDRASYTPSTDHISLPERDQFTSAEGFYGTALHELTHWTGHASRLNRLADKNARGYAFEELVAELGAYLASELLDCPSEAANHASYLESWLKCLESEPEYLWKAAAKAEAAASYLHAFTTAARKAA
jgi:antirestriction protein ArdC